MKKLPEMFYARNADQIALLAESGLDPNITTDTGHTPLHLVRNYNAVRGLLKYGANVKSISKWKESVLHKQQGNAFIVRALISAGADVNALDEDGDSPLHMAFTPGVVFQLLKSGANPNITNNKGELPEAHYRKNNKKSKAMTRMVREVRSHGRVLRRSAAAYMK